MINNSILPEEIRIFNVYAPSNRALNYVRQKLIELQEEIADHTMTIRDLNTLLAEVDRSCRQDISEDIPRELISITPSINGM